MSDYNDDNAIYVGEQISPFHVGWHIAIWAAILFICSFICLIISIVGVLCGALSGWYPGILVIISIIFMGVHGVAAATVKDTEKEITCGEFRIIRHNNQIKIQFKIGWEWGEFPAPLMDTEEEARQYLRAELKLRREALKTKTPETLALINIEK